MSTGRSAMAVLTYAGDNDESLPPAYTTVPWPRHNNGVPLLFLDGHTGWALLQACISNQDDMWGHSNL